MCSRAPLKYKRRLSNRMKQRQGLIQKVTRGKFGPQLWKEGAEKWHLNVHFSFFLIFFCKILQKRVGGGYAAPPLNPCMKETKKGRPEARETVQCQTTSAPSVGQTVTPKSA